MGIIILDPLEVQTALLDNVYDFGYCKINRLWWESEKDEVEVGDYHFNNCIIFKNYKKLLYLVGKDFTKFTIYASKISEQEFMDHYKINDAKQLHVIKEMLYSKDVETTKVGVYMWKNLIENENII